MKVAVAGGTGVTGRYVVEMLTAAGHEPVALARSKGVDLVSGAGLDAALDGVDATIDVSNVTTLKRDVAVGFFDIAGRNLLGAAARAGVRHHVALSIVGIDRVKTGYYQG
ncbi:SDR family oxidoreductase [Actinoplanes sp. NPDC049668]|uniref:SDR family oxidoreductase n=1 Tax=unclassified Actinoplanes TaxID=2626549 RepID=UPI0033AE1E59